jgi:phosphomannomutase
MTSRSAELHSTWARQVDPQRSTQAPILFGTSGWRGPLGEEVTFARLRVLVRSVSDWIREQGRGDRVLIGWDSRFASQRMAETTAGIVAEKNLEAVLSTTCTPTPAITHALARSRCAAGLVLTASHNPAPDHGLKVFAAGGSTISDVHARHIESIAAARMHDEGPSSSPAPDQREDFVTAYRRALEDQLDADAMRRSGIEVIYDAMHGVGAGVLDAVLESAGATVQRLRVEPDPNFGGMSPDPVAQNLMQLTLGVRAVGRLSLGLATDGDGDRFGVVDGTGRVLTETQVVALLIDHLATTGQLVRGVAITNGIGSLVEKVALDHGLSVEHHPVGFKHLSSAIEAQRVDVAGEASGGFALSSMGPEKDGLLAGCLLANLVAISGEPLEVHVERLESRFGASACGRTAIAGSPALDRALEILKNSPPERLGRVPVEAVEELEEVENCPELRLDLEDGGFLMLRRSGTEPLLRVYAEASTAAALDERLSQGIRLLERTAQGL